MAQSGPEPRVDRPEVLVVSDERPTRAFVVRALRSSYDVIESKDSRGAIKTMYERWPWIPVVLLGRIPDRARLTGQMLLSGARTLVQKPGRRLPGRGHTGGRPNGKAVAHGLRGRRHESDPHLPR
jgi:hypothetical protein